MHLNAARSKRERSHSLGDISVLVHEPHRKASISDLIAVRKWTDNWWRGGAAEEEGEEEKKKEEKKTEGTNEDTVASEQGGWQQHHTHPPALKVSAMLLT
jgi:hypothetical protein